MHLGHASCKIPHQCSEGISLLNSARFQMHLAQSCHSQPIPLRKTDNPQRNTPTKMPKSQSQRSASFISKTVPLPKAPSGPPPSPPWKNVPASEESTPAASTKIGPKRARSLLISPSLPSSFPPCARSRKKWPSTCVKDLNTRTKTASVRRFLKSI